MDQIDHAKLLEEYNEVFKTISADLPSHISHELLVNLATIEIRVRNAERADPELNKIGILKAAEKFDRFFVEQGAWYGGKVDWDQHIENVRSVVGIWPPTTR